MNSAFGQIKRDDLVFSGDLGFDSPQGLFLDLRDFADLQFESEKLGDQAENVLPRGEPLVDNGLGIGSFSLPDVFVVKLLQSVLRNPFDLLENIPYGSVVILIKHDFRLPHSSAVVTISTSSKVVIPAKTLRKPSSRIERIPISRAFFRSSTMLTL